MSDRAAEEIIDPEWANFFRGDVSHEESLEEDLGYVPVFSLLAKKELELLARIVHIRRYATGETVIHRGVQQSGFYLIRSGGVHIVRQQFDKSREVVDTLGPGELLGEFALLDDTPRSSSIVAAEPSELIGFFKPDLMEILVTKPALGCKILLRLAEEMTRTLKQDYAELRAQGYPFPDQEDFLVKADLTAAS